MGSRRPSKCGWGRARRGAAGAAVGRGRKEEEQRELPLLPAGCPVKPLGKLGQLCHYLDEQGQMIALNPRDHGKTHIQSLFGRQSGLVHEYWPRYGKPDKERASRPSPAGCPRKRPRSCRRRALMPGCSTRRARSAAAAPGAGANGELIIHHGDKVYRSGGPRLGFAWEEPASSTATSIRPRRRCPGPTSARSTTSAGAAARRCCALALGAAEDRSLSAARLHRRGAVRRRARLAPHVWVTGDSSTGKSTLEKKLLAPLFDGLSLRTHDATEASIRQVLGKQTLPVFFDELEAEANSDRAFRVIKLARLASSKA
jgi:hypothetical protein